MERAMLLLGAQALDLPNSLTCERQEAWDALAATLSVLLDHPDAPAEEPNALPKLCWQLDPALIRWSVSDILNPSWSPDLNEVNLNLYE
ncbi:unnamed protein product, partial [Effrenium voratum]